MRGLEDFRFWIDSTDKSGGLYHQEILGQLQYVRLLAPKRRRVVRSQVQLALR
jgi:hypothetical protein